MTGTPYAPPAARVSDPAEGITEKPQSIRLAVLFLWISIGLAVGMQALRAKGYLQMIRAGAMEPVVLVAQIAGTAILFGLVVLVAVMIGKRRGWARWIYVVLYTLGTLTTIATLAMMPRAIEFLTAAPIWAASIVVQTALQTAAVAAMFVRPSREWFAARRKS